MSDLKDELKKYGISKEEYLGLVKEQGGCCALCREPDQSGRRLCVDHDHGRHEQDPRGAVRLLLCGRCNAGLGLFRDDPELLRRAATYLEIMPSAHMDSHVGRDKKSQFRYLNAIERVLGEVRRVNTFNMIYYLHDDMGNLHGADYDKEWDTAMLYGDLGIPLDTARELKGRKPVSIPPRPRLDPELVGIAGTREAAQAIYDANRREKRELEEAMVQSSDEEWLDAQMGIGPEVDECT